MAGCGKKAPKNIINSQHMGQIPDTISVYSENGDKYISGLRVYEFIQTWRQD